MKHWSENLDHITASFSDIFIQPLRNLEYLLTGYFFRFYTDLVEPNKMDEKPFFEIKIDDMKEAQVEKLKEFHKSYFNLESINNTASELKLMSEIRNLIVNDISEPSDEFAKFFAKSVYPSIMTTKVLEQFRGLVK